MVLVKGSNKAHLAGVKSAETKRLKKNYDAPQKNKFRTDIASIFNSKGVTLALESHEGLFVRAMPKAKHYLFEFDKKTYEMLVAANHPNVVAVFNSDVVAARQLRNIAFDQGFFDFCNSFDSNIERLSELKPLINTMLHVAFAFSHRGGTKTEHQTYATRILLSLQEMFPTFDVIKCKVYSDTSTMIGVVLKNKKPWVDKKKWNTKAPEPTVDQFDMDTYKQPISAIRMWMDSYAYEHWGCSLKGIFKPGCGSMFVAPQFHKTGCNIQVNGSINKPYCVSANSEADAHFKELLDALPEDINNLIIKIHSAWCGESSHGGIGAKQYNFHMSIPLFILKYIIADNYRWTPIIFSYPLVSKEYRAYLDGIFGEQYIVVAKKLEEQQNTLDEERRKLDKERATFSDEKSKCYVNYKSGTCPSFCKKVKEAIADIEKQRTKAESAFLIAISELKRTPNQI